MPEQGVPDEKRDERHMRGVQYTLAIGALAFLLIALFFPATNTRSGVLELWGSALAYIVPLAATAYAIHSRRVVLWRTMPLVWAAGLILLLVSHAVWLMHPANWPRHILTYLFSVTLAYRWWRTRRAWFVR